MKNPSVRTRFIPVVGSLMSQLFIATAGMAAAQSQPGASPAIAAAPFTINDLRTEGVSQPMGVEEAAPRFSWRYASSSTSTRGFQQVSCRIQVASSLEKLTQGQADLWDSGRLEGADTIARIYAGKPLQSGSRYFWQVTGYDAAGKTYTAPPEFFEMGLMNAKDWGGAKWIAAKTERSKTIPARLQGLTDYHFETKFRISEGSAMVYFRAAYTSDKGYGIEIQPGSPGKFIVTRRGGKTPEPLKEYPIPKLMADAWHSLKVTLKGADFSFWIDDVPVSNEPLQDKGAKAGTVALGAGHPGGKGKKGLVQFDNFHLLTHGETLVKETFEDPVMFAFQEYFNDPTAYAVVKAGVLEVQGLKTCLYPKEGVEAPLFRKTFSTDGKKVVRARAYVSGLGYYTFWLNGKRLDDFLLQPGFARYNKTAYYTVYDLTNHLTATNALAFELGRGWYGMTTPTLWGETFNNDWMAEPALRVLVTVDYADGSRQTVVSDPSFKTTPGPILVDSVKAGEIYDARKEQPGWNLPGFDDKKWTPSLLAVGKMPSAAPGLTAQLFEPIRVVESVSPVSITKIEDETDAWLVDFGKNMAGTVELKVRGQAGQRIRMSHHEITVAHNGRDKWNNFSAQATGNFQTDIFIPKGGVEETYQARYSYKGFRYLRIEGLKEKPSPSQFTAKVFNSDMARVGDFKTSSELWNKIWDAGRACIQSNMHSIPTDCPTWEKLGWTCDDASPYYAMAFNFDLRKLYEKRLQDYADDISADGKIGNVIPTSWAKGGDPAWVGSYVNLVWKHYQSYGDRRMMERHFANLKLYMSTLIKQGQVSEKPPLLTTPARGLGDWVSPEGNTPPEGALIYHDLYFYEYLCMMSDMAKVMGRSEDVTYYGTLATDLKKQFNEFFWDEKEGSYYSTNKEVGYRQSPNAISLAFGIVPEERKARVTERLAKDMRDRKNRIWTGILGMEAIADALCDNGETDLAFAAHLQDTGPSLGNMIREGATTLWEGFSFQSTRSYNHKMFATPLGWMARYVTGLRVDGIMGNGPGFRSVVIEPYLSPSQMKSARLDYDSPVGRYESRWTVRDDETVYDIVIPPNATASVRLPLLGKTAATVTESGKSLWDNGKPQARIDGCGPASLENGRVVIPVASGTYSFSVKTTGSGKP
jgi:alpha-L-rhamnosidase